MVLEYLLKDPSMTYGTSPFGHRWTRLFMWFLVISWGRIMSPSKRFPFSSRSAAKRKVKLGKTNSPLFHKCIPEFGRHDDTGGKIVQFCVLHRRLVVDSPVHSVPPLAACCKIVLDPLSVPPPHVLVHAPQLHALHSQLAQAGTIEFMTYIVSIHLISYQMCSPHIVELDFGCTWIRTYHL